MDENKQITIEKCDEISYYYFADCDKICVSNIIL